MDIQPIVIGTAGHIDHGKSTLVQALTGTDPDRWREEKERGMTIDLGFARMDLPDGRCVGIVDVPGHERFIRNMVAGASGIDIVVLVVAADDGVMPQTREHLAIMNLLGVQCGFVALTKIDMVDAELVELAVEDVRETLAGTFLADAPIMKVSAITGDGLDELRELLMKMAGEAEPRSADGVFRLPVQRVFSARGFGTIVTGIPIAGRVKVGDVLEVLPSGARGKVRGIQAYHEASDEARSGHSTALNLSDVDHKTVVRGNVVAKPGFFKPVEMVGAQLTVLADLERSVVNRSPVRVHTGTVEVLGEIVLLDADELAPGETGLVQFRLSEPVVCAPGDPFIVRLASPLVTLGGGTILEESRYRLKRFKRFVIDELERQASSLGSPAALLEATLARAPERWLSLEELAVHLKRDKKDTLVILEQLAEEGRVVALGPAERWIHVETRAMCLAQIEDALKGWFDENPTRSRMDVRELRTRADLDAPFAGGLLKELEAEGRVVLVAGGQVSLAGRSIELDEETAQRREAVLAEFVGAGFKPPTVDEIAATVGSTEDEVRRVIALLVDEDLVEHVGSDLFFARASLDEARGAVTENCEANGQLEVPALRDRLGTTRKFLIPVLEYFDAQGLTRRMGGHRILRRS
ncbi:MAG: selenocysteine-specific translation elongation factor [bacterium]|nr:selenocysteine-specific translation elongation factor [bacterium]